MVDALTSYVEPRIVHSFSHEQRKEVLSAGLPASVPGAAASSSNKQDLERVLCKSCSPACFGYRRGLELHGPERGGLGVLRIAHQGQREVAVVFISELLANYKDAHGAPGSLQAAEEWLEKAADLQKYRGIVWKAVLQQHQLVAIPMGCVTFDLVTSVVDVIGHKMNLLLQAEKSVQSIDSYVECMQQAGGPCDSQEFQAWLWTQSKLARRRFVPLSAGALQECLQPRLQDKNLTMCLNLGITIRFVSRVGKKNLGGLGALSRVVSHSVRALSSVSAFSITRRRKAQKLVAECGRRIQAFRNPKM